MRKDESMAIVSNAHEMEAVNQSILSLVQPHIIHVLSTKKMKVTRRMVALETKDEWVNPIRNLTEC